MEELEKENISLFYVTTKKYGYFKSIQSIPILNKTLADTSIKSKRQMSFLNTKNIIYIKLICDQITVFEI